MYAVHGITPERLECNDRPVVRRLTRVLHVPEERRRIVLHTQVATAASTRQCEQLYAVYPLQQVVDLVSCFKVRGLALAANECDGRISCSSLCVSSNAPKRLLEILAT